MSTSFLTPQTELEAINEMLRAIGESPLDTLDQSFADADIAKALLRQELRSVQNYEWVWNTEIGMSLAPDGSGHIHLPQNTLRVICEPTYTQRGSRLYDRTNHTYEFTQPVVADLVVALNFDEVPEAARRFITIRAARRFINDIQPDASTHSFKQNDERSAWASLLNNEAQVAQWNLLNNSALNLRLKRYRPGSMMTPGVVYGRE